MPRVVSDERHLRKSARKRHPRASSTEQRAPGRTLPSPTKCRAVFVGFRARLDDEEGESVHEGKGQASSVARTPQ